MIFLVQAKTLILTLLCFPVVLWILEKSFAGSEGEVCHSWTSGVKNPNGAFRCPQRPADVDAKFCCGTCSAPYCCSSKEARLDQALCPAGRQRKKITKTRHRRTVPATNVPLWVFIVIGILAIIFLVPFGCGLISGIRYIWRQFHRWWESRNLDQRLDQISLTTISIPSMFEPYPTYDEDPPPSYSEVMDPHGPWALSRTSNVPPVEQQVHENAGYQDSEAQPSPSHPTEPASEMGVPHPSQACVPNPEPSDAEESSGDRAWPPASDRTPPPSYKTAIALDRADPPPYNTGSPYGSWAAAGARALINPLARSAAQGNPRFRLLDLEGVRLRHSAVASPTLASDDQIIYSDSGIIQTIPLYNVASTLGRPILPSPRRSAIAFPTLLSEDPLPDRIEVSHGHQIQLRALESPSAVQFQCTAQGATEAPPTLPDTAAAGPILEPVLKAEEPEEPEELLSSET